MGRVGNVVGWQSDQPQKGWQGGVFKALGGGHTPQSQTQKVMLCSLSHLFSEPLCDHKVTRRGASGTSLLASVQPRSSFCKIGELHACNLNLEETVANGRVQYLGKDPIKGLFS